VNDNALGGLLLVAIGVALAWLWYRGYFNDIFSTATAGLSGTSVKKPFQPNLGTVSSSSGRPGGESSK
jgi:hypothetical protein